MPNFAEVKIEPLILSGHKGPVYTLCKAPAGNSFFSGSGDGTLVRWRIGAIDGEVLARTNEAIYSAHLHGNDLIFIGTEAGAIHVIELRTAREIHHFTVHRKGIFRFISIGPDRIACAAGDGSLSIWDIRKMADRWQVELYRQIPLIEEKLRDLEISDNGDRLVIAGGDGQLRILGTNGFNEIGSIGAHPGTAQPRGIQGASSVVFHPSKPVLISGGKDGHLRFWRTDRENTLLQEIAAHKGAIYQIAFDQAGSLCATGSRDGTIKIWDARTFDPLFRMDRGKHGHTHSVNSLLWMDRYLVSASDDRSVRCWPIDVEAARTFGTLRT